VLDDETVLTDSSAILDYLDSVAGPERALMPSGGTPRREAMQLAALAIGAAEKGREQIYERVFRPTEKRHEPWLERCRSQMHGALGELEHWRASHLRSWITGEQLTQADITVTCCWTFLVESVALNPRPFPELARLVATCEVLPEFRSTHVPWNAPRPPMKPV
jgi:glutathione S-transferase